MRDDAAEFAEFYEQHRVACRRAFQAVVRNPDLAEDLVAESFARAWATWGRVRHHPAPQAWVVRTGLNAHRSRWRRRRRESAWPAELEPPMADAGIDAVDSALLEALRGLSARQREVVVLRVFLDLDTGTTAQTLGIAPGTVRAHLHRAMESLRASDAVHSMRLER